MNQKENIRDISVQKDAVTNLIESSSLTKDFYLMLVLSTILVSMGLILDNVIIVIGGMLVSPFLSPLLRLSLSIVVSDSQIIRGSILSTIKAVAVVLPTAFIVALLVPSEGKETVLLSKIFESTNLFYLYVSLVAGVAGAYAWAHPKMSSVLPGVAISVTLLPPLVTMGIGLSFFDGTMFMAGLRSSLVNLLGLLLSATFVFSLMGFYRVRSHMKKEILEEVEETEKGKKENGAKKGNT
ncbi:DUF389 domain-containing protein [Patescibacteria group bacterium]